MIKTRLYTFFISIFFTSILNAQQKPWTLLECLNYAREHNLQLKQGQLEISQKKINKTAAIGAFLPDLNANSSVSWNNGLTQNFTTGILENQTTFGGSGSVNAGMNLFNGMRNHYTYKKSLLEIISVQHKYADLEKNINMQIASAYIEILLNKENLESARIQLENSIRQKKRIEEMIQVGILPKGDLSDAEAQITNDNWQVVQAENTYELAKINLAQLLEVDDFENFEIDENLSELKIDHHLLQSLPENLFEKAVKNNQKIKQYKTQEQIADYQIKMARSGYLPSLGAFFNINTRYSDRDQIGFGGITTPADPFWNQVKDNKGLTYGLNLRIPVLNGFNVRNQLKQAQLNKKNTELITDISLKNLKNDVYKMHKDLKAAFQSLKAAEANLKAQRKAFDYANEKFKVGMLNTYELNNIKTNYVKAKNQYINIKYQYYLKSKILEFTIK